jgi:hypothetical protein
MLLLQKIFANSYYNETSNHCYRIHCIHANIVHFLWSLYIANINKFPTTTVSRIHRSFFAVPSEIMDRGFTVTIFMSLNNKQIAFVYYLSFNVDNHNLTILDLCTIFKSEVINIFIPPYLSVILLFIWFVYMMQFIIKNTVTNFYSLTHMKC